MKLLIGLEKEFFLLNENNVPLAIEHKWMLPHDDCGWLVEARGNPCESVIDAVFSLKASIFKIERSISKLVEGGLSVKLNDAPYMKVGKATKISAARLYTKSLVSYQNLKGYQTHRTAQSESTAGVHISLTKPANSGKYTVNENFDWPSIFNALDKAFAEEIKSSKRNPGFYEVKPYGRVEYRSLPSNVSLEKVIDVLEPLVMGI